LLLYPFEWLALAAAAATIVFLRAHGLRVGWRALELTLPPMFARLPAILGAGLLVHALATVARRGALRAYLAGFLRPASIVLWLRVSFAFMLVTFAYAWLKVCVPLVNRSVWDAALWRLERALHLGFAPNVFAVELVSGTPLLPALDLWYSLWLATVFLAWAWAAAHSDLALRRNFVFGCALLSIAGSWLYLALPALGPCYALPELFDGVRGELPRAAAVQDALAANYAKMIAGRDGSLRQFNPYLGVAALPSLHVGAHWFFALWAKRHARRLYLPWAIATALTFFGALATGWHYAVDGYAGLLLAWGVFALGERLEPTTDASGSGKAEPTPAAGDETLRTASAPAASRPESGGTA
jgi:hypothetical protein